MRIINKYQWGGPSPILTAVGQRQTGGDTSDARTTGYMVPLIGTALSMQDAYKDPTKLNLYMSGLSLVGDIGMALGLGQGLNNYVALQKALRAAQQTNSARTTAKTANAAKRILKEATKNYQNFNPQMYNTIGTLEVPHAIEYGRKRYDPENKFEKFLMWWE